MSLDVMRADAPPRARKAGLLLGASLAPLAMGGVIVLASATPAAAVPPGHMSGTVSAGACQAPFAGDQHCDNPTAVIYFGSYMGGPGTKQTIDYADGSSDELVCYENDTDWSCSWIYNPPPAPPPSATGSNYTGSTSYQTSLTFTPSTSNATSVTVLTQPAHGTANASGKSLTYTPAAGYYGADLFTWRANGDGGNSGSLNANITVNAPPAPIASGYTGNTAYETALTFTPSVSGVSTGLEIVAAPGAGSATVSGSSIIYTPAPGYIGADSFTYRAVGPGGNSAAATADVSIAAPAAPSVAGTTLSAPYDAPQSVTMSVTGVHTSLAVAAQPAHGSVAISGDALTYTPQAGYFGPDVFEVVAAGPGGTSAPATVSVTVATPVAPTVSSATLNTAYHAPQSMNVAVSGAYTSLSISSPPTHGAVAISGTQVTYTPDDGYVGQDAFDVTASGPGGASAPATVTVDVASPGTPVVQGANVSTDAGSPVDVQLSVSGVYSALVIDTQPNHGTASLTGTTLHYAPAGGFDGSDEVRVVAIGPGGNSAPAVITLAVAALPAPPAPPTAPPPVQTPPPVEAPPTAMPLVQHGRGGTPIVFHVTQRGSAQSKALSAPAEDDAGKIVAVELVQAPSVGEAHVQGLDVIFTPPEDWSGQVDFLYRVENAKGLKSAPATLTAIVKAVPVVAPDKAVTGLAGKRVTVDLGEGALGGPFTGGRIVSATPADAGEFAILQDGGRILLSFVPKGQFNGDMVVRYTLSNADGESDPEVVRIAIAERANPANDAEVTGLLNAQTEAASRFGAAQIGNVTRRLEALRDGMQRNQNGIVLAPGASSYGDVPGEDLERTRAKEQTRVPRVPERAERASDKSRWTSGGVATPENLQDVSVWAGGVVELGSRDARGSQGGFDFNTDGVSVGVDAKFTERLFVGAGVGAGRDVSKVGDRGTKSKSESYSLFAYGSYRPNDVLYVDGVLGLSHVEFTSRRATAGNTVDGERDGQQLFGALSAGFDVQAARVHLSPYGRVELNKSRLGAFTETGDDTYALSFGTQNVDQVTGVLGIRGDYKIIRRTGTLVPMFRAEYRLALNEREAAQVSYADWADSPIYRVQLAPYDDRRLMLGLGLNWYSISGWTFTSEVETSATDAGGGTSTSIRVGGSGKF